MDMMDDFDLSDSAVMVDIDLDMIVEDFNKSEFIQEKKLSILNNFYKSTDELQTTVINIIKDSSQEQEAVLHLCAVIRNNIKNKNTKLPEENALSRFKCEEVNAKIHVQQNELILLQQERDSLQSNLKADMLNIITLENEKRNKIHELSRHREALLQKLKLFEDRLLCKIVFDDSSLNTFTLCFNHKSKKQYVKLEKYYTTKLKPKWELLDSSFDSRLTDDLALQLKKVHKISEFFWTVYFIENHNLP